MAAQRVRIFDTTLRDGEQTPGVHLTTAQKVLLAEQIENYGADTIEAGFPVSSPGDFEAVRAVARAVRNAEVAALARCRAADVTAAAEALEPAAHPVIHVVLGVSDIHLRRKLGVSRAEAIRAIAAAVAQARCLVPEVEFSAEDATRADPIFLRQCVVSATQAGATRVNIADTVGCAVPDEFGPMIRGVVDFVEGAAIVSAHCHNDLGLATANTVAAVRNGAGQVEVTVNGIGERAGNAALEEVGIVLARKGIAATGLRLERATEVSALVAETTGVPVQPNRAIVGANAFAHSSGIHQDGIIKDPENYEYVSPVMVGAPGHRFVLTARSGRSAVAHVARSMGYTLDAAQVDDVYTAFLMEADATRGAVSEAALARVIRRCMGASPVNAVGA